MADLIPNYFDLPQSLRDVLQRYEDCDDTYQNCIEFLGEVEALGYTFEYGIDAVPYDLKLKK